MIAPHFLAWSTPGVAAVFAPFRMNRDLPQIIGQLVMIEGDLYRVKAVHRRLKATPIKRGETIGLVVESASGWLAMREFGKPDPVAWVSERGGPSIRVISTAEDPLP